MLEVKRFQKALLESTNHLVIIRDISTCKTRHTGSDYCPELSLWSVNISQNSLPLHITNTHARQCALGRSHTNTDARNTGIFLVVNLNIQTNI